MLRFLQMKHAVSACALAVMLAPSGHGGTIASVGPVTDYSRALMTPGSGVYSFGWSQTGSYTNVVIRVDFEQWAFSAIDGAVTGYLTDQVGTGTTMLNNELTPSVTVPYPAGHSGLFTIFDGLTLGPGDYFVTITGDNGLASIGENALPTVVVDSGVSLLGFGMDCCTPSSYLPAQVTPFASYWAFEVTGDPVGGGGSAVPEPATGALMLGSLVALAWARRRR